MPKTHTRFALFCAVLLMLSASLSLLGCGGCAGTQNREETRHASDGAALEAAPLSAASQDTGLPILPVQEALSTRASDTYSYLLVMQALLHDDETALLDAIPHLAAAKTPPQGWLEAGVWLMGRKSPNSVIFLEQALRLWPDDVSLNLLLAEALVEHGKAERGVSLMRDFLQRRPDSLDARLELSLLLVKTRQFEEARSILSAIKSKERSPLVEYYQARALIGMGRQRESIPHLRAALKEMPDFVDARAELAYVLEQLDRLDEARAAYEELLRQDVSRHDVLLRLISLSLRLKQPAKALRYMEQGPDSEPFRLTVASMLIESRHFTEAEKILRQMEDRGQAGDDVHMLLAELTWRQRRTLPQALAWLDRIAPESKNQARSRLLRTQLLIEAGQEDNARRILQQGQADFGHMPDFFEFEARLLAGQRKWDDAIAVARKACSQWPDNGDMFFLLGSLLDEKGDKVGAMQIMEDLAKRQPDNHQALNYVGYTLAEQGRELERALQLLIRANDLAPNQAYIVDSLAWALFRLDRTEEAFREISRAASLNEQGDPTIWEHYGDIARSLGRLDEARKGYSKALELKPANADSIRQRLSEL